MTEDKGQPDDPGLAREEQTSRQIEQMRKGTTSLAILKLLADSGAPMHGYQIIRELEHRGRGTFEFQEGLIYPRLHQMERNELLESRWEGEPGTRRRKVYTLTEKGHRQLQSELRQWDEFRRGMNLLLEPEQS